MIALASQGQITITYTQVPHTPGNQFQYYVLPADSVLVDIGQLGGPQTWDFSGGDTSTVSTDTYLDPAQSPPEYSRANVVIQTDQLNLFGLGEPGNLYCWLGPPRFILGAATTSYQGTPLGMTFTPYISQYPLPLTMGRTWSNQVNVDQIYNISGTEYRIELHATLNSQVDAWGTMVVPLGSYGALRTRTDVTYDLTVYIRIFFVWIPVVQENGSSISYDWRAQNVGLLAGLTTQNTGQGQVWTSTLRRLMNTNTVDAADPIEIVAQPEAPANFELYTNHPNPFNAQTAINYQLTTAGYVTLTIHDALGRTVGTLAEGWQEPGIHEVLWTPQNLAAGAYFVQLRAGRQMATQMMLYLK
jgi:hypothetical protein